MSANNNGSAIPGGNTGGTPVPPRPGTGTPGGHTGVPTRTGNRGSGGSKK